MPYKPTGRPNGRPPKLPSWHRKAITVELAYVNLDPDEPWPSSSSVGEVAAAAGVSRRAIRQRRKCPLYHAEFMRRLGQLLVKRLDKGDAAEEAAEEARLKVPSWWEERSRKKWAEMDDARRALHIEWWAKRNWIEGQSQRSPLIRGHMCEMWQEYADHMLRSGALPDKGPFEDI